MLSLLAVAVVSTFIAAANNLVVTLTPSLSNMLNILVASTKASSLILRTTTLIFISVGSTCIPLKKILFLGRPEINTSIHIRLAIDA